MSFCLEMIIFLDSIVLGKIAHTKEDGEEKDCRDWYEKLLARGARIITSEICNYEVRRSLILASMEKSNVDGLLHLKQLEEEGYIEFLPITKDVSKEAARIWAESQKSGIPMTSPEKIDVDAIICAHWKILTWENPGRQVIVATSNIRHLNNFTAAFNWQAISL